MIFRKKLTFSLFLFLLFCGCNTFEWDLKKKPNFIRFEINSIQDTSWSLIMRIKIPMHGFEHLEDSKLASNNL